MTPPAEPPPTPPTEPPPTEPPPAPPPPVVARGAVAPGVVTPRVVLVGAPGAGKTTVGTLLAQRWGCSFHDTDAAVEAEAGMPVSQIFITQGEPHFRELERAAVARALAEQDGVVALGGGAVMDAGTRTLLRGLPVVWLQVGLTDALDRVGMNQARPLLLGNVRGTLLRMLQERAPLYEQVGILAVPTDGRDPQDVVATIATELPGAIAAATPAGQRAGQPAAEPPGPAS